MSVAKLLFEIKRYNDRIAAEEKKPRCRRDKRLADWAHNAANYVAKLEALRAKNRQQSNARYARQKLGKTAKDAAAYAARLEQGRRKRPGRSKAKDRARRAIWLKMEQRIEDMKRMLEMTMNDDPRAARKARAAGGGGTVGGSSGKQKGLKPRVGLGTEVSREWLLGNIMDCIKVMRANAPGYVDNWWGRTPPEPVASQSHWRGACVRTSACPMCAKICCSLFALLFLFFVHTVMRAASSRRRC